MSPLQRLQEKFAADVLETHAFRGDETVLVRPPALRAVAKFLKDTPELDFNFLMDLTAVDYLFFAGGRVQKEHRFEVVYHFFSLKTNHRIRIKVPVDEKTPEVDTLCDFWASANWYEREVWDMFGIKFKGHPNLKRILMYEEFQGHALRKDYPFNKRQPLIGPHELMTQTRSMLLNVGPSHPAMHGVIRMIMELDGEKIKGVDIEIGYLHRAFEKMCETVMYAQCFPYTDRLNYVSPLINNVGFALAVEKLLGIDTPERAKYIRVIMSEISRVTDHLTCVGASAMELGAMSVFLYMIKAREFLYELVEEITGARLTISYVRIGGVKADLTAGFTDRAFEKIAEVRKVLIEADELLTRNRIFFDRMKDIGKITPEDAMAYGITGPFLRATGVALDVRKSNPYLIYDKLDFEVPVGSKGDNLDRYFVRMAEMEQSLRIIEQCFQQIPEGPIAADLTGVVIPAAEMVDDAKRGKTENLIEDEVKLDPTLQGSTKKYYEGISANKKDVVLPAKENTYGNIEGLMNHFKLVMYGHGIHPPVGEVYFPVEGANGELGFYIVSDGRDHPWRVRVHPPCFPIMAALPKCLIGDMMADLVPTFGSVNMIAGELDR